MSQYTTTKPCWYCDDQPGEQCDACDDRRPLIAEIDRLRALLVDLYEWAQTAQDDYLHAGTFLDEGHTDVVQRAREAIGRSTP